MDLSDLETFVAVAECRSFSRAAERLHLTQPAVSKRIQALEARLDTVLLDRIGKRVELTHGGRLLLPRARSLLDGMADTRRLLKNLNDRVTGALRVATSHHIGLHRLAPVLKAFSQRYGDVRLDIRFEDSEAAHDLVRRGESELAVVTLDPAGCTGLTALPLWKDPLAFLTARDHPLARRGALSLPELAEHPAILPGPATYTGRIIAERFAERGIVLRSQLATNYLETIRMLTGIGLGWSVLPASMITAALREIPTDTAPMGRMLGCVCHPDRTRSNAAQAFLDVLEEFAD